MSAEEESKTASVEALPIEGPAAPPRRNGELVFEAPWESRAFGLAVTLIEAGAFSWADLQAALIEEIRRFEAEQRAQENVEEKALTEPWHYWRRWLAALTSLTEQRGLLAAGAIDARSGQLAGRPHGHDH